MSADAGTVTPAVRPARWGGWRSELGAFLELFALSGLAFAQPALDLLQKNAGIFVVGRTSPLQLVMVTVVVLVAPAALLYGCELVVGVLAPRARPAVHVLLAAGLVAVLTAEVVHRAGAPDGLMVAAALAAGGGAALLLHRVALVGTWLRVLAVAPVLFGAAFLFTSPAGDAVFAGGPAAAATEGGPAHGRLVMVVLDQFSLETLLDGHGQIDADLYPSFAALARESTWYRNSTTVAPNTEHAVPAILTGRLPDDPAALPDAATYPDNLFTLLGGRFRVNANEKVTSLCPKTICPATGASGGGVVDLLDTTQQLWRTFAFGDAEAQAASELAHPTYGDPAATQTARRFLESLQPSQTPVFDYAHLMIPHHPWHYVQSGQDYEAQGPAPGIGAGFTWASAPAAALAQQRNLTQAQAADTIIGRIVAKLRRIGAYDDATIVITADHGVSFTAGQSIRGVGPGNYPSIMWTPLLVKAPGQHVGAVDDSVARSIDIVPTVAQLLGVRLPWRVDGHSLLGPRVPDGQRPIFEWGSNMVRPPAGSDFLTFDGPAGFATVLRSRQAPVDAAGPYGPYRIGPYAGLVGRRVDSVPQSRSAGEGTLGAPGEFDAVDPHAPRAPWLFVEGSVDDAPVGQPVVVSVNGTIAGGSWVLDRDETGAGSLWALLAPEAFRDGRNDVVLWTVSGSPDAPVLARVATTPEPGDAPG
jgi:hypothetical protein